MESAPTERSRAESLSPQSGWPTPRSANRSPVAKTRVLRRVPVDHGAEEAADEPTENAEVRFEFREREAAIEGPPPSDAASAEFEYSSRQGVVRARVPGVHTPRLLELASYMAVSAGVVLGPECTFQVAGKVPGPDLFLIATLQIAALVWIGRGLIRHKR